jgi:hypothetical protein
MLPTTTISLLLAALAPHLAGTTTTRYQVTQRMEQEVDASSVGGPKQAMVVKTTSFIAVTLTDSASGKAMKVVVDSVRADSLPPGLPADSLIKKAKGAIFTGFVDASGKVTDLKGGGESLQGLQMESLLRDMYPRVRKGIKTGDAWTDTTTTNNKIGGGEMSARTITNYKAGANETVAGLKATRLDANFSSVIAGSQATAGGSADIEGTGTGTANYFVGPNNEFLGSTSNSTSNLSVTILGAQTATLPVSLKQMVDIKVLR